MAVPEILEAAASAGTLAEASPPATVALAPIASRDRACLLPRSSPVEVAEAVGLPPSAWVARVVIVLPFLCLGVHAAGTLERPPATLSVVDVVIKHLFSISARSRQSQLATRLTHSNALGSLDLHQRPSSLGSPRT